MTEAEVKKQLRQMLRSFTAGSLLHLLAEIFHESAQRAQRRADRTSLQRSRDVASTLFVLGLGIDAVHPR